LRRIGSVIGSLDAFIAFRIDCAGCILIDI
jgi:hypothetical protein